MKLFEIFISYSCKILDYGSNFQSLKFKKKKTGIKQIIASGDQTNVRFVYLALKLSSFTGPNSYNKISNTSFFTQKTCAIVSICLSI